MPNSGSAGVSVGPNLEPLVGKLIEQEKFRMVSENVLQKQSVNWRVSDTSGTDDRARYGAGQTRLRQTRSIRHKASSTQRLGTYQAELAGRNRSFGDDAKGRFRSVSQGGTASASKIRKASSIRTPRCRSKKQSNPQALWKSQ